MKKETLFEALSNIDAEYISEAYGVKQRRKKINRRLVIAVAAAALVLAVGGWAVLSKPFMVFNGEMNELDIEVMYEAKILTAEEMEALGGVADPGYHSNNVEYGRCCNFDSTPPNELFSAMNISPLRSSRVDYDSCMYTSVGFEPGISSLSYTAEDSVTGKRFIVQMTWYNTPKGLSMGGTYLMMSNYETYTLACGAEAMISLPEPGAPEPVGEPIPEEERTEEQQLSYERYVPDGFKWVWFAHDNITYFIRTQHSSEEVKEFLDTFS